MPGTSEPSDSERERYERIYDISTKLLALLEGGLPEDSLDLVVEMLKALLDDAVELEVSTTKVGQDAWRHEFRLSATKAGQGVWRQRFSLPPGQVTAEQATPARISRSIGMLASIGRQVDAQQRALERAISSAKAAFRELTAGGTPSSALLQSITRAVREIQSCGAQLEVLGHERTAAVSLASLSPRVVAAPSAAAMPATGPRDAAPLRPHETAMPAFRKVDESPADMVPAPRFPEVTASPATTNQPPRYDEHPGGSFRAW